MIPIAKVLLSVKKVSHIQTTAEYITGCTSHGSDIRWWHTSWEVLLGSGTLLIAEPEHSHPVRLVEDPLTSDDSLGLVAQAHPVLPELIPGDLPWHSGVVRGLAGTVAEDDLGAEVHLEGHGSGLIGGRWLGSELEEDVIHVGLVVVEVLHRRVCRVN